MTKSRVLAAVVFLALFHAAPAFAQMVCEPHEKMTKRLLNGYQEVPAGAGVAGNAGVVELFTSEKGTFTIVLTRPNGMSCLMAVGDRWEAVKDPTPVGGEIL